MVGLLNGAARPSASEAEVDLLSIALKNFSLSRLVGSQIDIFLLF